MGSHVGAASSKASSLVQKVSEHSFTKVIKKFPMTLPFCRNYVDEFVHRALWNESMGVPLTDAGFDCDEIHDIALASRRSNCMDDEEATNIGDRLALVRKSQKKHN